jgi:hypothetical protein
MNICMYVCMYVLVCMYVCVYGYSEKGGRQLHRTRCLAPYHYPSSYFLVFVSPDSVITTAEYI